MILTRHYQVLRQLSSSPSGFEPKTIDVIFFGVQGAFGHAQDRLSTAANHRHVLRIWLGAEEVHGFANCSVHRDPLAGRQGTIRRMENQERSETVRQEWVGSDAVLS